jgi:hypothetical protein
MFDGDDTSGYILYDYKTRSVNIPCFEVATIAKFGDGIEGEAIYYKDVNMKQRHVAYPIFHVDNMTKTDSCIPTPQKLTSKAQLKGNLSNANVKIYRVEDNGDKTLLYKEQTNYDGLFYEHKDELEDDKFYFYEISGGGIEGTIRAVSKGAWITKDFKVSLASEIAYIYLAKNLKYDFDAIKVENRLNEVAKTILGSDISGDGNVNVDDLLVFDYQSDLSAVNSSEFSSDKLEEIVSDIYQGDFGYGDRMSSIILSQYNTGNYPRSVAISNDNRKVFIGDNKNLVVMDITDLFNPTKIGQLNISGTKYEIILSQDETKAFIANGQGGLVIVNIKNPTSPSIISRFMNSSTIGVTLSKDETTAFIASHAGLIIVDITDITNPTKIGFYRSIGNTRGVTLSQDGTKAFLADTVSLIIIDVTDPTNPTKISTLNINSDANMVALSQDETKAFVAGGGAGLVIVDITDVSHPSEIGRFKTNRGVHKVILSKNETKAFLIENDLVAPSRHNEKVKVINIKNPSNSTKLNSFSSAKLPSDIAISNDDTKAFIADWDNGLVIIDLELFNPISNKPKVKAPKTTTQNSVIAKVIAPVGSQIIVNHVNTGVTIPKTHETNITLDTSGVDGNKTFAIKFVNIEGVESNEVIVTIKKLGLIWQDNNDVKVVTGYWQDGINYCKNLILDGYSDWRLPTIKELESIIKIKNDFKNMKWTEYWSSTPYTGTSCYQQGDCAWYIFFRSGNNNDTISYHAKGNRSHFRCVR